MCSAEHARRTSYHPELAPLRCCLRLGETTPVLLVQVLSLLAQCAPGVWRYQPQRVRPCTNPSTLCCLEMFRDIELPVFMIPPVSLPKQGPKASRIARQSLNAMAPV